jgi:hypothetical protein
MATYTIQTANNKEQDYYDRIAQNKQNEVKLYEGDFIILKRPSWFSMNYVFHKGQLRFIGNYDSF